MKDRLKKKKELRRRLALEAAADPGGLDTALMNIGRRAGLAGEHAAEERDREAGREPEGGR